MHRVRKITVWLVVIAAAVAVWVWLQGAGRDAHTPELEYFEFPLQISAIGDSPLTQYDPVTIVVTINCELSSLDPGCGADQLFASMGDCVWDDERIQLTSHKLFKSGYEEARWDLRLWENGPLWLTSAHHFTQSCLTEQENLRRFIGSVHFGFRTDLD